MEQVDVEWTYEPVDLLEESWKYAAADGSEFSFDTGKVSARLPAANTAHKVRDRVEQAQAVAESILRAGQLLDSASFSLKLTSVSASAPDGGRAYFAFPESIVCTTKVGRLDMVASYAAGNTIRDTKRERIASKQRLAAQFAGHRSDQALSRMLRSLDAAFRDPADALVHLWEVREAFRSRLAGVDRPFYKSHEKTCERLDKRCNSEPLLEGRHRGKFPETDLRPATPAELAEAHEWAAQLVKAYAEWLDDPARRDGGNPSFPVAG
jgi:hypothetical protein